MSDDLRWSLSQLTTAQLADIVARHDLSEWVPDVFPVAESILQERNIVPPEPPSVSPPEERDDDAVLSQMLVGLPLPTELRNSLSRLSTRRLIAIAGRHDSQEWRPEVFDVAESLLRERGAVPPAPAGRHRPSGPEEPVAPPGDLVRLAELPNPALVPLVKSLLERSGFRFFITNEEAQGLFAAGQLGLGYNPITGPPSLFVEQSRLDEARELLTPLFENAAPQRYEASEEDPSS